MRFSKLGCPDKIVTVRIRDYFINWDKPSASKLQTRVKELLYPYWKSHIVCEELRIPGSLFRIDFLNCTKRLAVEFDGIQHNTFNKHFHRDSRAVYLASIKRDIAKVHWLEENKINLLNLEESDLKYFSAKYIQDKFNIDIL